MQFTGGLEIFGQLKAQELSEFFQRCPNISCPNISNTPVKSQFYDLELVPAVKFIDDFIIAKRSTIAL